MMIDTLPNSFLFSAQLKLAPPLEIGNSPEGFRAIYAIEGGTFEGPRLKGRLLSSGGEWARIRPDGSMAIDVRSVLETDDGALIYVTYFGRLVIPAEIQSQVLDLQADDRPGPENYYLRMAPLFETASEDYAWLNGIQAIATGEIVKGGVNYQYFALD